MTLMEDSLLLLASHVWYGSVRRTVTLLLSQTLVSPKLSFTEMVPCCASWYWA